LFFSLSLLFLCLYLYIFFKNISLTNEEIYFIPGLYISSFFFLGLTINYLNRINFWYLLKNTKHKFWGVTLTEQKLLVLTAAIFYILYLSLFLFGMLIWKIDPSRVEWIYVVFLQLWYFLGLIFFYKLILSFSNQTTVLFVLYSIPLLLNLFNLITTKILDVNLLYFQPLVLTNDPNQFYAIAVGFPSLYFLSKAFQKQYFW